MLYPVIKRTLDIAVATAVLGLGLPLWLVIAAAIRLTSPGPALYRRQVIGRDGRPFTYFKFRSIAGADPEHALWLRAYVEGGAETKRVPAGVTAVGRLLRRTSLDEIPQLLNVLRGDMTLVGPRPPLPEEAAHYDARARRRLSVRPGLTGLYQVTARGRATFTEMLDLDLAYVDRRSLSLDVSILLRTLRALLKGS